MVKFQISLKNCQKWFLFHVQMSTNSSWWCNCFSSIPCLRLTTVFLARKCWPNSAFSGIGSTLLSNVAQRQLPEYKWYNTDVIAGLFTGSASQRIAESLGMKILYDFAYAEWTVKIKETGEDKSFFDEMTSGNYSAKIMVMQIGARVSE